MPLKAEPLALVSVWDVPDGAVQQASARVIELGARVSGYQVTESIPVVSCGERRGRPSASHTR